MAGELDFLFKAASSLNIYIASDLDPNVMEDEIKMFDPKGLLKDFRMDNRFNVLTGKSIQEAKKEAKGYVGPSAEAETSIGLVVLEEDKDAIRFLGTDPKRVIAFSRMTPDEEEGRLLGLPSLSLKIVLGMTEFGGNVQKDKESGFWHVFATNLDRISRALLQTLQARIAVSKAA